jgi:hypothetical protein
MVRENLVDLEKRVFVFRVFGKKLKLMRLAVKFGEI